MRDVSIINAIETDERWNDTPLKNLFNYIETNTGYVGHSENLELPCYARFCNFAHAKNISEIKRSFVTEDNCNAEFKFCMYIRNYAWFNSFLDNPILVYNEKAFSDGEFKIKYIKNISYKNVYVQTNDEHVSLTFFNNDLSQLFTIYTQKTTKEDARHYKYEDVDNTHINEYEVNEHFDSYVFNNEIKKFVFIPAFEKIEFKKLITEGDPTEHPDTIGYSYAKSESKRVVVMNNRYWFLSHSSVDEFFFKDLQKLFRAKNIQKMQDLSNVDFWDLTSTLGLTYYISPNSGTNRVLKYKIIIINKLLGYDKFNEKEFSLKQLHFNKVKNDYYFTNKLSLSKILEFNFITENERKYLKDMKNSLSGDITMIWKKKEVDLLFDKDNATVRFGSVADAVVLIGNKTENQIKDKFKMLYNTMVRKRYFYRPYLRDRLIIKTEDRLELALNRMMEDYRKSTPI